MKDMSNLIQQNLDILSMKILSFELKEGYSRFNGHQAQSTRPLSGEFQPVGNEGGSASLFYQQYALVVQRNKRIPTLFNNFD